MAAFGDKIQSLMDEVYSELRKEENRGKGKWDVLDNFSEAHQIAVVFGNFNNQVENGGLEQWVYNGYFHDNADKFIGYLESGAELDERCQTMRRPWREHRGGARAGYSLRRHRAAER